MEKVNCAKFDKQTNTIKKVLIVANYISLGSGISVQVSLLHLHLNEDGVKTDIYSTKKSVLSRIKMFYNLSRVAKRYDVIHIHCCSNFGFFPAILGVTVAKKLKKRVLCTFHGGGAERFFKRHSWLVKYYLNKTDENIVHSGFLARIFDCYNLSYQIIPNILQTEDSYYRVRSFVNPKFISIRTLQPLYNIQCIIRAFAKVKQSRSDAELYILSDGICRNELEQLVSKLNLSGVHFEGFVPNTKIYDYLDKADIFVSMPKIDNQPMSILEAYKSGLLVISSRVGGVPYMIEDYRNGMMVESDNHLELAEKMLWALNHQKETIKMMAAGHREIDKYIWKNIKERIIELYFPF